VAVLDIWIEPLSDNSRMVGNPEVMLQVPVNGEPENGETGKVDIHPARVTTRYVPNQRARQGSPAPAYWPPIGSPLSRKIDTKKNAMAARVLTRLAM
jgi:hypothetical protein